MDPVNFRAPSYSCALGKWVELGIDLRRGDSLGMGKDFVQGTGVEKRSVWGHPIDTAVGPAPGTRRTSEVDPTSSGRMTEIPWPQRSALLKRQAEQNKEGTSLRSFRAVKEGVVKKESLPLSLFILFQRKYLPSMPAFTGASSLSRLQMLVLDSRHNDTWG